MERYTAATLEEMPVLCEAQADDLHVEGEDDEGRFRVWLCRCDVADGMPYDNQITIERYRDGSWVEVETYEG